ncbi:class I SAM-dependent methyltransferase [Herbaspirillum rhizosphaerae]|uniref:class I SAM-dependent methyltransferase n=1 Tax=Herbaspirillum rhizosphaerae TaxID=346179 RepID=UPI00067BE588|nr:methyltransferase domain-containing protein [Herbaspirillum rhizosphaerae]
MDSQTLNAYDNNAAAFADDWLAQPAPDDMYALLTEHFAPGPTADIGCGAGRDVAWLNANGFDAVGYDGSAGLLEEAQRRYPTLTFESALLPALDGVPTGQFQNVLCETVIMHLEPSDVPAATARLLALLRPGGTLYLSWRVTDDASQRDKHQRLYAAFDAQSVLDACSGYQLLFNKTETSLSSGKTIQRLIVRKP